MGEVDGLDVGPVRDRVGGVGRVQLPIGPVQAGRDDLALTYRELDRQASRVSAHLLERGLGPGDRAEVAKLANLFETGPPPIPDKPTAQRGGAGRRTGGGRGGD